MGGSFSIVPWGNVALVKYGTSTDFVHGNALQSSTYVTDQAGAVKQDQILYPWGQSWKAYVTGTLVDGSFATIEPLVAARGEETGTTLNRNYSESYGRWLSPDSVRGDVTNPQSLNLYSYVTNNPATLTDPTGLCGCGGGGGFGGFGSGGGGGWGGGGGCGGGGGGGGHRLPPVIPVPGPPTVSVPGGSFPNPFTTGGQPPSPWFNIILDFPLPPWDPGSGGNSGSSAAGSGKCHGRTSKTPIGPFGSLCSGLTGGHYQFVDAWTCTGDIDCCGELSDAYVSSCYDRGPGHVVTSRWIWGTPVYNCCKEID